MTQPTPTAPNHPLNELAQKNRQLVEHFFQIFEAQNYEAIKELFAPNAQKLMPYAPAGVDSTVDGIEAIYKQFTDLPELFTHIHFPRRIFTTDDPNFVFALFTGDLDLKKGGKYENKYVGTFKLQDGKITEYSEYFNPFLMAEAFGFKL